MHTLIPNSDPNVRILLHRTPASAAYVTVEDLDKDAIGTPQWRVRDDSRRERLGAAVIMAMIDHAMPAARHAAAPTVLGTYDDDDSDNPGLRYTLDHVEDELVLIVETAGIDCASAPRWNLKERYTLTYEHGKPRLSWYAADTLIATLYP